MSEQSSVNLDDEIYGPLSEVDWAESLGFDPNAVGVDVGHGLIDGEFVGLMRAMMCAIVRSEIAIQNR